MQKLMINQAYENMGLASTQMIATLFDGIARNTAEGLWFRRLAEEKGFHEAVAWRDSGRPIPGPLPTPAAPVPSRRPRRGPPARRGRAS